jgi:tetratricopeptide (TPR) repeat protein
MAGFLYAADSGRNTIDSLIWFLRVYYRFVNLMVEKDPMMCANALEKCELGEILETEGSRLCAANQNQEAIELLQHAIELCESCNKRESCLSVKLGKLAIAFLQDGRYEEARQTFERAAGLIGQQVG